MWPRDAYVGQRVVCIADGWPQAYRVIGLILPRKGTVYTVRHVEVYDGCVGVHLSEIKNRPRPSDGRETLFDAHAFKPVDESRLDVFRSMLKNAGNKNVVREDA